MAPKHSHAGHRLRLKAKFSRVGLDGFEDHEVLEFLLTFAIPQKDVNPLAHDLINHFGSLNAVFNATPEQLQEINGIGNHAATLLTIVPQLAKRYLDEPAAAKRYSMATDKARIEYFIPKFVGAKNECIYVAFLNASSEVITCQQLSEGSISAIRVEARKLIDMAVRYKATSIVLAHNHFGQADPSIDDIATTQDLSKTLGVCGIHLLDHIVVCRDRGKSLSRMGHIKHVF